MAAGNAWATLRVDGTKYATVRPDDVFAQRFRLLELRDDECATVQYGDDYRFDICEGHTRALP